MHELLSRALELGSAASGLTDARGDRVEVSEEGGLLRCRVRTEEGELVGLGWRCGPADRRPPGWPEAVPFLPQVSCVGIADADGITATWPAEGALGGGRSGMAMGAGFGGPGLGATGGAVAGTGFGSNGPGAGGPLDVEGAARDLGSGGTATWERLAGALERWTADDRSSGWSVVEDRTVEGEVAVRAVRLREPGVAGDGPRRERALTLSRALGVTSLVWSERVAGGR